MLQIAYNDTLTGVDRLWQQLNSDIQFLSQRFTGFPRTEQSLKTEEDSIPGSSLAKQELLMGLAGNEGFKQVASECIVVLLSSRMAFLTI